MVSYTWALNDCFALRMPSYMYGRNVGVMCLFHDFKSCSFAGDFFTLFLTAYFVVSAYVRYADTHTPPLREDERIA